MGANPPTGEPILVWDWIGWVIAIVVYLTAIVLIHTKFYQTFRDGFLKSAGRRISLGFATLVFAGLASIFLEAADISEIGTSRIRTVDRLVTHLLLIAGSLSLLSGSLQIRLQEVTTTRLTTARREREVALATARGYRSQRDMYAELVNVGIWESVEARARLETSLDSSGCRTVQEYSGVLTQVAQAQTELLLHGVHKLLQRRIQSLTDQTDAVVRVALFVPEKEHLRVVASWDGRERNGIAAPNGHLAGHFCHTKPERGVFAVHCWHSDGPCIYPDALTASNEQGSGFTFLTQSQKDRIRCIAGFRYPRSGDPRGVVVVDSNVSNLITDVDMAIFKDLRDLMASKIAGYEAWLLGLERLSPGDA